MERETERGKNDGQNERQIKINSVWKCFRVASADETKIHRLRTEAKVLGESSSFSTNISLFSPFRCRINKYVESIAFATFIESLNELNEFGFAFFFFIFKL